MDSQKGTREAEFRANELLNACWTDCTPIYDCVSNALVRRCGATYHDDG